MLVTVNVQFSEFCFLSNQIKMTQITGQMKAVIAFLMQ